MKDVLVKWWKAHKIAEENPRLLSKSVSAEESRRISNLCAARMQDVGEADETLFAYAKDDIEPLAKLFIEHDKDKGCIDCWISSNPNEWHKKCKDKIARWFGYRAALMTFVFETYIRHGRKEDQIEQNEEGREKE